MSAIDTLLILDSIKGESRDKSYPDSIQLLRFEFSGSATGSDNPAAGRVQMQDVVIHKRVDTASMGLWSAMVGRKQIRSAKFIFRRASSGVGGETKQTPYLEITLSDVYVVSMVETEDEGHAEGAVGFVQETVTFNFSKIDMTYTQQNDSGAKGVQSAFSYIIPRN